MDWASERWYAALGTTQLPALLLAAAAAPGSAAAVLVVSDVEAVGARLAAAIPSGVALAAAEDASAAGDAVSSLTADENDGRFMIASADWGAAPRWAALAELFALSTSRTVACAGPYSPSTFCALAAAIAAARAAATGPPLPTGAGLWRNGKNASSFPAVFWCPPVGADGSVAPADEAPPPCCETLLLDS